MVDFVFYPYSYHLLPNRTEAVLRCQRGFLTLRDCIVIIYGSITVQFRTYFKCWNCTKFHYFILSIKCQVIFTSFSLLTAWYRFHTRCAMLH